MATNHKMLIDIIFEYDDVIHQIPPTTLNSWCNIPNYRFARRNGTVYITKSETKYITNKLLSERLAACEHNIEIMQKYITEQLTGQT
jgi:hypothetical protein